LTRILNSSDYLYILVFSFYGQKLECYVMIYLFCICKLTRWNYNNLIKKLFQYFYKYVNYMYTLKKNYIIQIIYVILSRTNT